MGKRSTCSFDMQQILPCPKRKHSIRFNKRGISVLFSIMLKTKGTATCGPRLQPTVETMKLQATLTTSQSQNTKKRDGLNSGSQTMVLSFSPPLSLCFFLLFLLISLWLSVKVWPTFLEPGHTNGVRLDARMDWNLRKAQTDLYQERMDLPCTTRHGRRMNLPCPWCHPGPNFGLWSG